MHRRSMRRCARRPHAATSCAQPACVRRQVPLLYWLGGVTLLFSWYVQSANPNPRP